MSRETGGSSGGSQRDGLLGSAFEALIGALYLDADLKAVAGPGWRPQRG
jgi:dsRNA-specific ribonuclease